MSNHSQLFDYDSVTRVRENGNRTMDLERGVLRRFQQAMVMESNLLKKFASFTIVVSLLGSWLAQSNFTPHAARDEKLWEAKRVENYLGYENCRKCHQMQVDKLVTTEHFKSFETVHRSRAAKSFCKQLGIRSIKRDERCVRCHYTPEKSLRGIRAQSGISCESCHGPSKNWIQGHNDYGGLTITKSQETDAHKSYRIKSSIDKGMRHPSNLYLLAKSCYECHLIDDAELVNVTDHPSISSEFNMVSWSQGSMRHNFLRTDNQHNAESSEERLRVMFIVDIMAKLEAALKSLALSKPNSEHFEIMQKEYFSTAKKLLKVSELVTNAAVKDVIDVLKNTPPNASQAEKLNAATKISGIAFEFARNEKTHVLDSIQDLLPSKDEYR